MSLKKLPASLLILMGIILFGAFLRLYQIGVVPHGLTWDEAVITYDGWNIATWHRDLWGNFMPLTFKSFGDYKAPLMIYLLSAVFTVFEVNDVAIRVISALSGIVLIPITYCLAPQIFSENKKLLGLVAAALVAISPWSLHFSRIGLEANLAVTLVAAAVLLFFWSKKKPWLLPVSALFFLTSLFAYHSAKLVVPLLMTLLVIRFWQKIPRKNSVLATTVIVLLLGLIPFVLSLKQGGTERGKQALIFYNTQDELIFNQESFGLLTNNLLRHASLDFWTRGEQTDSLRHIVPGYGTMYWGSFILFLIGLTITLKQSKYHWILLWVGAALLPSILSRTAPHAIRSSLAMPAIHLLAAYGFTQLFYAFKNRQRYFALAGVLLIAVAILLQALRFWDYYWGEYAVNSALDFQYGYEPTVEFLKEAEKTADKVIMTDTYGQPFVYVLLYKQLTAEQFQQGALANYEFRPINWPGDKRDSLFAATPEEIPPHDPSVLKVVTIPGTDTPVWVIAKTQESY